MITRTIEFKPYCSECYHSSDLQSAEDSKFDVKVSKKLSDVILAIKHFRGSSYQEKANNFLLDNPARFNEAVGKAIEILTDEGYTHYISAIHLGASKFAVSETKNTVTSVVSDVDAVIYGSGGGGSASRSTARFSTRSREIERGNVAEVDIDKGEELVEYNVLPVYELICQNKLKEVFKEATRLYLERPST